MKTRCLNEKHVHHWRYGGRGITICARWRDDFLAFLADMGPRPTGTSLERRDNGKGYSPDNCYWASAVQQGRNRSTNRLIEFNGDKKTLSEWAEFTGIGKTTIRHRLNKGWAVSKALTEPVRRVA